MPPTNSNDQCPAPAGSGPQPPRLPQFEPTKILLLDEQALFRAGARTLLAAAPGLTVVGETNDGKTGLELASTLAPDVVLISLSLPTPGGIAAATAIKRELPSVGIIILANVEAEESLFEAIKSGAAAFASKDIEPAQLLAVIGQVANGEYLINEQVFAKPAVAGRVLKEFRHLALFGEAAAPLFAPLSRREVEVLDSIAQGMTNKAVAYALSISEQTVKNHISSVLRKLNVNDRTQAVVYALRQGWIKMPGE